MTQPSHQEHGTILRGADGRLYFIPQSELAAHVIPDEVAEKLVRMIDEGGTANVSFSTAQIQVVTQLDGEPLAESLAFAQPPEH